MRNGNKGGRGKVNSYTNTINMPVDQVRTNSRFFKGVVDKNQRAFYTGALGGYFNAAWYGYAG